MHTCFVRLFRMRYRRSTGEIVLQPSSSNPFHLSRSRRHRQLGIPLGKLYKSRVLLYSRARATNVWYVDLLVGWYIRVIDFSLSGLLNIHLTPSDQATMQALVASGSSMYSPVNPSLLRSLPPPSERSLTLIPPYLRHPLSNSDG